MDVYFAKALESRGLGIITGSLKTSALAPNLLSKIVKALEQGVYPGDSTIYSTIYREMAERHGLPYMTVRRTYGEWQLRTITDLPQQVTDALLKQQKIDDVAYQLTNNGKSPSRWKDGPKYGIWSVHSAGKKSLKNIKAITALYANTEEYKLKAAALITALRAGKDIEL